MVGRRRTPVPAARDPKSGRRESRWELARPELIKTVPHVAFEVDDLEAALEGQEVIYPPGSPSEGVRAAMIVDNGALVELIWFRKNSDVHEA